MEEYWKNLKYKSDEEKIAFIEKNQYRGMPEDDKLIIILSLKSDESKMKAINMLSSERNKARVAVSLMHDENKAKLLGTVIRDIFDIEMIKATMGREKQVEAKAEIEPIIEEIVDKENKAIGEKETTDKEIPQEGLKKTLLEDEIRQLKEERAQDKEQIARLQKMLETTLGFCDKVRQSTVGKIFFGKDAKKLPTKNELPEGGNER